ncbi:glutamate-1-semialdehyde 2,1-aminomutase, chloroplastic-like protein, partial [Tanacetum coccineum]
EFMSGGANSRVRAFKSVGGQPIVIDSVKGSHVWDIDGNEYIDYVGSWGPAIIGHVNDEEDKMVETVVRAMVIGGEDSGDGEETMVETVAFEAREEDSSFSVRMNKMQKG